MDMIIRNGTVVSATGSYKADVAVKDGKIAAVGSIPDIPGAKVVDAAGKLVLPGAIDAHTHLAMPFGGTVSSDDYFAGTRAAACGGTTTVFDFALQDFNETMTDTFNRRNALAAPDAAVDYSFHIGVKDIHGDLLDSIKDACDIGITSYKVFMVYDFGVKDGVFYQLLAKSKEFGALIAVHAENNELVNTLTEKYISEGKTDAWYHYMSRPEFVEAEADKRAVHWAKHLDAPLYLVHMADKEGLEACIEAKEEGADVFVETCPQYLEFTCDVYKREDGRNFVCSPPMKGQESQDALWKAIKNGMIDTVATDHCPFQSYEKDWGKDDFTKIPNGCPGVENLYPYMLDAANSGKITFERAVELCSTNVAKIFGCDNKGSISVGKDADIVIYDKDKDFTISVDNMHSDLDHTIWEGKQLHGYPIRTYLRGNVVYDNGDFVGTPGLGEYVKRSPRKH